MKSHKCRIMALLCLAALLLAGCNKETNLGPGAMGSEVWTDMPTLTYGKLESEKLEVLPWNSGRCEATSYNEMAETENGYYYGDFCILYYADKLNLSNWVIVCNQPECDHVGEVTCNGRMVLGKFVIKGDRIYYEELVGRSPYLYQGSGSGFILVNVAADGTDKRFSYAIEDAMLYTGGSASTLLSSDLWLYGTAKFNSDGSITTQFFRVDQNDQNEILKKKNDSDSVGFGWISLLYGDKYFSTVALDTSKIYRLVNDQLIELDISKIPDDGGYISGSTLRFFKQNDGYYDRNIETGEEVKLTDAQIKNSYSSIVLPNCIVESTLLNSFSLDNRTDGITHSMKVFDGETWRSVKLPDELLNIKDTAYVYVRAVTSDSILFVYQDNGKTSGVLSAVLYRIPLDSEELVMEYCGEVKLPTEDEK